MNSYVQFEEIKTVYLRKMTTYLPATFARLLPGEEEAGLTFSSFRISLLYEVRATKTWKC